MLKLFIELVVTGTLIAGGTPVQDKPGDTTTIVPKTVQPVPFVEKGFQPSIQLAPLGSPVEKYAPVFQMPSRLTPPKPLIIKRLKWPHERSA